MIPKVIHYCWFGRNPLPELAVRCINSWKNKCPDYKIIEWNEDNFDLSINPYVAEAYREKQWAFVTDYVRLYVLVNFGGIYMDTDVEVLNSLDKFLNEKAFSGFENEKSIPTGIMASEKNFELFKELLLQYEERHFIRKDGSYDKTTNVYAITKYCLTKGLILNNKKQTIDGFTVYSKDYFCPKDYQTGEILLTNNSYTIHHFSGSWNSPKEKKWRELESKICSYEKGKKVVNSKIVRMFRLIYVCGLRGLKWKVKEIIHLNK